MVISMFACQTCLLSAGADTRSFGPTPNGYWSSGRKSLGFIISRLLRIQVIVCLYSRAVSAPGCLLKCSFSFLHLHCWYVIQIRFSMKPVSHHLVVFLPFLFYSIVVECQRRVSLFSLPWSSVILVISHTHVQVAILSLFYCEILGLCTISTWFWYSVL